MGIHVGIRDILSWSIEPVGSTLHTVLGSDGAKVDEVSGIPFGWGISSTYMIKIITHNDHV